MGLQPGSVTNDKGMVKYLKLLWKNNKPKMEFVDAYTTPCLVFCHAPWQKEYLKFPSFSESEVKVYKVNNYLLHHNRKIMDHLATIRVGFEDTKNLNAKMREVLNEGYDILITFWVNKTKMRALFSPLP